MKSKPLTEDQFDRLTAVLERFGDKRSMNLEMLDGFLVALICGPDLVPPSEYLPEIWGDNIVLEKEFSEKPVLEEFLSLIMRHWNAIVDIPRFIDSPKNRLSWGDFWIRDGA